MERDEVIITENGSVFQHGKYNDRVYLMKLAEEDIPAIIDEINDLAHTSAYQKIFAKIPLRTLPLFRANGYISEAYIPGYIKGKEDIHFVSKFLNSDRLMGIETDKLTELSNILSGTPENKKRRPAYEYDVKLMEPGEADELAELFRQVFASYPFPIHDPGFISTSMQSNTRYFGMRNSNNQLIAVSSAETDPENLNAEMTDFAVSESYRGKNLSVKLLQEMEKYMASMNIRTLYTIARLNSLPMNKTFLRQGYKYTGTLIKNTNISGSVESMNVLYKSLK